MTSTEPNTPQRRIVLSGSLTAIPDWVFDHADTLEHLDLGFNQLSSLPDNFSRLKKLKILFASGNRFSIFPEVLSDCPELNMVGFKSNQITTVPENAFPEKLRWLILTDNHIREIPASVGKAARLQKFMLAGNRLTELPEELAACHALELLRISANELEAFPEVLLTLPRLAWLAFAGNPFHPQHSNENSYPTYRMEDITLGAELGRGASGVTHEAGLSTEIKVQQVKVAAFAAKIFKKSITSDGYTHDELAASLAAGQHPGLVRFLAKLSGEEAEGLLMARIPDDYKNLGDPPDFDSCTRDIFAEDQSYSHTEILSMARQAAEIVQHLRNHQVCHGDIYAHNMLVNQKCHLLFGDFGAASNYAALNEIQQRALEAIEVRALGCLIEDLAALAREEDGALPAKLSSLIDATLATHQSERPDLQTVSDELLQLTSHR